MDTNVAEMAAAALTNAAQLASAANQVAGAAAPAVVCPLSPPWAIAIDVITLVCTLALRISLLSFIVGLLSRHTADLSFKKSAFVALLMSFIYGVLCISFQWKVVAVAVLAALFAGCLFCKWLFWMDMERSVYACFIFLVINGGLTALPILMLDRMAPGRATVSLSLARVVDNHVRAKAGDPALPPSKGFVEALGRMSISTNESPLMSMILSPLKTEQKLRDQIAAINQVATENARLVNELSGAGSEVRTRKEESEILRKQMGLQKKEGKNGTNTSGAARFVPKGIKGAIDGIGSVAGDEAAVVDALSAENSGQPGPGADAPAPALADESNVAPEDVPAEAAPAAAPEAATVAPPAPLPSNAAPVVIDSSSMNRWMTESGWANSNSPSAPAPEKGTAPSNMPVQASAKPVPPPPPAAAITAAARPAPVPLANPSTVSPAPAVRNPFAGLPDSEVTAWKNSMTGLVVTSIIHGRAGKNMAMVNGDFIYAGESVVVSNEGRNFTWKMMGITNQQTIWSPIISGKGQPGSLTTHF